MYYYLLQFLRSFILKAKYIIIIMPMAKFKQIMLYSIIKVLILICYVTHSHGGFRNNGAAEMNFEIFCS